MTSPYRESGAPPKPAPPAKLECWLRDGDKNAWIRRIYVKLSFTGVAAVFVTQAGVQLAAIPIVAAGLLWMARDVLGRKGEGIVFRVDDGSLRVDRGRKSEPIEVPLDDLLDVRLDTKGTSKGITIARADGVNTIFGMHSGNTVDVDVSRIELVIDDGGEPTSTLLSEEFLSSTLTTESLRTIRLFLRAHGWRPSDERQREAP